MQSQSEMNNIIPKDRSERVSNKKFIIYYSKNRIQD